MNYLSEIYSNKRVLVTGHTGFKGSWLSAWLHVLGAEVAGVSLDIPSSPSNFNTSKISDLITDYRLDIRNPDHIYEAVQDFQPDFIFHLAAQALVRPSYDFPLETFTTNSIGTCNVLESIRKLNKNVVGIMITSDKSYDNVEWVWGYRETDRLGGKDPYSASKGMAELAIRSYVESFFNGIDSGARIAVARAGNVIGGGDWARDRIVADCIRAWSMREMVDIRSPHATRPWQHVLEPLSGYLTLGARLAVSQDLHGQAYNFGPPSDYNFSVKSLIEEMKKHWDNVQWNDVSLAQDYVHEAELLKLNCDKALFELKWKPTLSFEETVKMTVDWYKMYYQDKSVPMDEYTFRQINEYTDRAAQRGMIWAQ